MSDSYQAIYDATRSRLSNCDVGSAVEEVMRNSGIGDAAWSIKTRYLEAIASLDTPSAIFRPAISIDGNQWCALYGENLQDGVAGFGDSPGAAMRDFDNNWFTKLKPKP